MVKLRGTWTSGALYEATINAIQNDYGRILHLQMQNDAGSGVNVATSGATLISARRRADSTNLISGQSCTVTSGLGGLLTYTVQSGDFTYKGKYHVQVSHRPSTQEITCDGFYIYVREDYAPR